MAFLTQTTSAHLATVPEHSLGHPARAREIEDQQSMPDGWWKTGDDFFLSTIPSLSHILHKCRQRIQSTNILKWPCKDVPMITYNLHFLQCHQEPIPKIHMYYASAQTLYNLYKKYAKYQSTFPQTKGKSQEVFLPHLRFLQSLSIHSKLVLNLSICLFFKTS